MFGRRWFLVVWVTFFILFVFLLFVFFYLAIFLFFGSFSCYFLFGLLGWLVVLCFGVLCCWVGHGCWGLWFEESFDFVFVGFVCVAYGVFGFGCWLFYWCFSGCLFSFCVLILVGLCWPGVFLFFFVVYFLELSLFEG